MPRRSLTSESHHFEEELAKQMRLREATPAGPPRPGGGRPTQQPGGGRPIATAAASYILYVAPPNNDRNSAQAAALAEQVPSIKTVYINQIPALQRPQWLTKVPSLLSLAENKCYTGSMCFTVLSQLVPGASSGSDKSGGNIGSGAPMDVTRTMMQKRYSAESMQQVSNKYRAAEEMENPLDPANFMSYGGSAGSGSSSAGRANNYSMYVPDLSSDAMLKETKYAQESSGGSLTNKTVTTTDLESYMRMRESRPR